MGRPKGYYTKDRQRVPSVTTFLKHLDGDAEGLIHWAHRLGSEGKTLEEGRIAANIGTITHACIEADLYGQPVSLDTVDPEMRDAVEASLSAWRLWKESIVDLEVVAAECSLTSEEFRFGGTLDAVLMINGKRTLIDFKTGSKLYGKELAQVYAYSMLWEEAHPDQPIERYSLLRLGKDDGAFTWKHLDAASMEHAREAVILARKVYDLAKKLQKTAA